MSVGARGERVRTHGSNGCPPEQSCRTRPGIHRPLQTRCAYERPRLVACLQASEVPGKSAQTPKCLQISGYVHREWSPAPPALNWALEFALARKTHVAQNSKAVSVLHSKFSTILDHLAARKSHQPVSLHYTNNRRTILCMYSSHGASARYVPKLGARNAGDLSDHPCQRKAACCFKPGGKSPPGRENYPSYAQGLNSKSTFLHPQLSASACFVIASRARKEDTRWVS